MDGRAQPKIGPIGALITLPKAFIRLDLAAHCMMLNEFIVILAQATPPGPTTPNPNATNMMLMGMVVLTFVAMMFITNRAQSKKAREHDALLKSMKPGDKVVTTSGIMGVVVSVKEKSISLRSAESKLEVLKSAVSGIIEREGEAGVSESKAS